MAFEAIRDSEPLHPDERSHLDACRYYEDHWIPPPPNAEGLYYSVYGWNRVYSGELTHWILGKAGAAAKLLGWDGRGRLRFYRLVNVGLGTLLVGLLWFPLGRDPRMALLGLGFLCIPQVLYIFTYVNSDAISLVFATLLLIHSIRMATDPAWNRKSFAVLLLLTVLTGSSRLTHLAALVPAWGILALAVAERWMRGTGKSPVPALAAILLMASAGVLAWREGVPRLTGATDEALLAMKEERAAPGYRPGSPTRATLRIEVRQRDFRRMLPAWFRMLGESAYARFGKFMDAPNALSRSEIRAVGAAAGLLLLLSVALLAANRAREPLWLKGLCLLLPAGLAAAIAGALFHSYQMDWQPQGRYLFGVLPAALLLATAPLARTSGLAARALALLGMGALAFSFVVYHQSLDRMLL